jgi:hypothetical protein
MAARAARLVLNRRWSFKTVATPVADADALVARTCSIAELDGRMVRDTAERELRPAWPSKRGSTGRRSRHEQDRCEIRSQSRAPAGRFSAGFFSRAADQHGKKPGAGQRTGRNPQGSLSCHLGWIV